jgi:hypothetical protein
MCRIYMRALTRMQELSPSTKFPWTMEKAEAMVSIRMYTRDAADTNRELSAKL